MDSPSLDTLADLIECGMCGQRDAESSMEIYHQRHICRACQRDLMQEADKQFAAQLAEFLNGTDYDFDNKGTQHATKF